MSDFVKIGNRIINKANVVSIEYDPEYPDYHDRRMPRLIVNTVAVSSGDTVQFWWAGKEAVTVWKMLRYFMEYDEINLD